MFPFTKKPKPSHQPQIPGIKKPKSKWRYIIWTIVIIIIGVIGWFSAHGFLALKKITSTNNGSIAQFFKLGGNITPSDVKTEGDSRINILVTGIGGGNHQGPDLTDTMQIISIDPINKKIALLSVPRDLLVKQDLLSSSGKAYVGYGKINAVNANGAAYCQLNSCAAGVDQGGAAMEAVVSQVTGVKINYFVRIDFTGFENLINDLGGIDVDVTTKTNWNGEVLNGLYDPIYPEYPDCTTLSNGQPYHCQLTTVNIPDGETHMNGALALEFVRSRETTTDFDRSKRQQQVMEAVVAKAETLGFFTDPSKVTSVINDFGNSFKTDIPSSEFSEMISLIHQSNISNATVAVLDTSSSSPLTDRTDTTYGYIIYPKNDDPFTFSGLSNYTDVHTFVSKVLLDPYVVNEQAKVVVINATGESSEDTSLKSLLTGLGYNIVSVTDSAAPQYDSTITTSSSKPYTESLLKQRFSANEVGPSNNAAGADITLTVGENYLSN